MLSKVMSFALSGLEGVPVTAETDINNGLPSYELVGLPDAAVKESRERVRSALKNSGRKFPLSKITVNLAPADIKKEGSAFDLAIAVGILKATEQLKADCGGVVFLGELALDGALRAVSGILPLLISAKAAGYKKFVIPAENAAEASYIEGIEVYAANNLTQAIDHLSGLNPLPPVPVRAYERGAKGEYIARADADDVYPSDRFSKQVKFLDEHPEISVCGSWQRHFGKRNYIQQPPETKEEMKASLLFGCEVCHSTVMMRRKDILSLDKLYDPNYLSEDYELWSRAAQTLNFATIPEVLGEYRWNGENITAKKMNLLDIEAQKIVRRNLEQSLDMQVSNDDLILLSGWNNPFQEENEDQFDLREREKVLLDEIEEINKNKQVFDQSALEKVLDRRRIWAGIKQEDILFMAKAIAKENSENKLKLLLKKLLKPLYRPIRQRFENRLISIQESVWRQDGIATEAVQSIHDMDGHLYDYFSALDKKIAEQNAVQIEMQKQLTAITQHILELQTTIERVSDTQRGFEGQYDDLRSEVEDYRHSLDKVLLTLGEVEENLGQQLNDRVEKAENYIQTQNVETITNAQKDTEQRILNELESEKKEIIQSTDTRIWKAEKLINQTTDGRIWKMERNVRHDVRAGFQNVYLANCLSRDNQNTEVSMTYDDIFYFENRAGSVMSARAILSTLLPHLECRSMVDFGCGTGTWLWVAHGFGVESIRGLDGDYVPPRQLMIPQDCFCAVDLEEPVVLEKKYDLAISMEVAEHLHKESADTFVESLCNAADTILFSAAHPGQGGDGHINEQPMTYWTSKFGKHGFLPVEIRQLFEGNEDIESWYRENIVLYVREAKVRRVEKNLLGKSE